MAKISIYRGEVRTLHCIALEDGVPVNLTGASLYFAVWPDYPDGNVTSDANATISKTSTIGGQMPITNALVGAFDIYLVKADSYGLAAHDYVYGIECIKNGYTEPVVLDQDTFEIMPDVVRAV